MKVLTVACITLTLIFGGVVGCKKKKGEKKSKGDPMASAMEGKAKPQKLEYTGSRGWTTKDFSDTKPTGGHASLDTNAPTCNAIVNATLDCGNQSMRTATNRAGKMVAASTTNTGVRFRSICKKLAKTKGAPEAEKSCKAWKAELMKDSKDCIKAVKKVLYDLK